MSGLHAGCTCISSTFVPSMPATSICAEVGHMHVMPEILHCAHAPPCMFDTAQALNCRAAGHVLVDHHAFESTTRQAVSNKGMPMHACPDTCLTPAHAELDGMLMCGLNRTDKWRHAACYMHGPSRSCLQSLVLLAEA